MKEERGTCIWSSRESDGSVHFHKEYRIPAARFLFGGAARSRASREYRALLAMDLEGLPVAVPLWWAESRVGPFLRFSVLVTRSLGEVMPLPDWLRQSPFRAPRLHQAYRLAFAGDQFVARGDADRAQGYYRRAERTALDYLDRHPDAPHTWQVLLGIGRLRQKQGRVDEALETFDTVLRQVPADMPAYGVAHYYCGLIYENERKDPARALEHYRSALESAESGDDFLEQLIRFYATERVEKRDLYAVASLTQTVTSAAAVVDKLAAAVERCEAGAAEERPAPQDAAPEAARRERIEFIPGD